MAKKHYRKYLPVAISEIWAAQTMEEFERAYAKATDIIRLPWTKVREDLSAFANSGQQRRTEWPRKEVKCSGEQSRSNRSEDRGK